MINRASGRVALISEKPMQVYDEDTVTLMRRSYRPTGGTFMTEDQFEKSAWETISEGEFIRIWDAETDTLPKTTTRKLFVLTGLLLPIWKSIPNNNERIYRVTPEDHPAMIGRTVSEDGAAALRARFMIGTPKTPDEMLTVVQGTTTPVDLGQGMTLTRRRVAGNIRLEINGADKAMIASLKALGCFTEIIQFQLRLFVPHGEGVDTAAILAKVTGQNVHGAQTQAA